MVRKIILDTDLGIDDALALFILLGSPEISIEGITLSFGNGPYGQETLNLISLNLCRLLQLTNQSIPIYMGAQQPLERYQVNKFGKLMHGNDLLGNITSSTKLLVEHPNNQSLIMEQTAHDFIIITARQYPGQFELITLGPLTNLSIAYNKYNGLPSLIKQVVCMGGAINTPGNVSPVAEANIWNDPEAAKIVFNAGFNLKLIPLNMTRQVHYTTQLDNKLKQSHIGQVVSSIMEHYVAAALSLGCNRELVPIHDGTAVLLALLPHLFNIEGPFYIDVETKGERTVGMTVIDLKKHYRDEPKYSERQTVHIAMSGEINQLTEQLVQRISRLNDQST